MNRILLLILGVFFYSASDAQNFWDSVQESDIDPAYTNNRSIEPIAYSSWALDYKAIKKHLKKAPKEFDENRKGNEISLNIPMPDGSLMEFMVYETSSIQDGLAAKFPALKSYIGFGANDKTYRIRFGHNIHGFYGSILSPDGTIYIDRYANQQTTYYISYFTRDHWVDSDTYNTSCGLQGSTADPLDNIMEGFNYSDDIKENIEKNENRDPSEPIQLRTYRLAIACTGEWGSKQGGTIEDAIAEMVISVDRINQVFENEVAIRLLLIDDNDKITFLDANSDPYNNANMGGSLIGQNSGVINQFVGFSKYDMGHIYTASCSDVGGIAALECICKANKGNGVTCHYSNNIIVMAVRVTCHEMGHQFGANHTFNNCNGNESGSNAFEPGSGSTIMSYGGLCGPQLNVVNIADDYYHNNSLEEMIKFSREFEGNSCATKVETSNNTPEASIEQEGGFYIPVKTPFELIGTAFDPEGDALTFVWEQMNTGPGKPLGDTTVFGPQFRTVYPSASTTRVFPALDKIINLNFDKTEVLPHVDMDLDFRFIIRDNNVEGGGVDWAEIEFEATKSAGPFKVGYPNGAELFEVGDEIEVNWDVANTDNNKVNCQKVDVYLSTDGGYTYPVKLLTGTPNDGAATITIPFQLTDKARIKIKGAGNVFFDISDYNFKIVLPSEPGYYFDYGPITQLVCLPNQAEISFESVGYLDFENPISFEVIDGLPDNATAEFVSNDIAPGDNTSLIINTDGDVAPGIYEITIRAIAMDADTIYRTAVLNMVSTDFSEIKALSPESGSEGLAQTLSFEWNGDSDVEYYIYELSDNPSFTGDNVLSTETTLTTYDIEVLLDKSTLYYWRVSGYNICGVSTPGEIQTFSTVALGCKVFNYADVPKNITQNGTPTIKCELNIFDSGIVTDVNVAKLQGTHEWIGDLSAWIIGPDGTEVELWSNECFNQSDFNCGFDDESPFEIACPLTSGQIFKPEESLSVFQGLPLEGKWTLQIKDNVSGSGGSVQKFQFELCSNIVLEKPFLVNNEIFPLPPGVGRRIKTEFLLSEDNDNDPDELAYTVVHYPKNGSLYYENSLLEVGSQFYQEDLDNDHIRYIHDGSATVQDSFSFTVVDDAGGWIDITQFQIVLDENVVLGTQDEYLNTRPSIYPNPVSQELQVVFQDQVKGEVQFSIYSLDGKKVLSQKAMDPLHESINVHSLLEGLYILKLETVHGSFSEKITVQY